MANRRRCFGEDYPENLHYYHDEVWGVPAHDELYLFEQIILETFQAGLSWLTILKKRENFFAAFDGFDPVKIAAYDEEKISILLQDKGIIRNRRKIEAAVANAQVFLAIEKEFGTFDAYIWGFTGGDIIRNTDDVFRDRSSLSDAVSEDLRKRGMKFIGTVTTYSYLQSVGIINDHATWCFRYGQV